ncbi:MAG: glycosyltransferase family A protein [Candidatus Limiplasma sp.]|nr:glycosyltransferase family A protein [Candidatus Limiplasma sp.]
MEPVISVIVPVYNGEKTLARCLDSVLAQSFSLWECIVVNDGSTDGTAALLESYRAKDARFQALSFPNGGVSRVKNLGMDKAKGKYLAFLDCDDLLEPHALETLSRLLEDTGADVAVGHLLFEDEEGKPLPSSPPLPSQDSGSLQPAPRLMAPDEAVHTVFSGQPFGGHLHGKLLRREKLQDLRYREGICVYEDMLFLLGYLQTARRLAYLPVVVHRYVIGQGGAMASGLSPRKVTSLDACQAMSRLVAQSFPSSLPAMRRFAVQNAIWLLEELLAAPAATREEPWAREARKSACRLIRSSPIPPGLPWVQKCFCAAISLGWPVFAALYQGPYRWMKGK